VSANAFGMSLSRVDGPFQLNGSGATPLTNVFCSSVDYPTTNVTALGNAGMVPIARPTVCWPPTGTTSAHDADRAPCRPQAITTRLSHPAQTPCAGCGRIRLSANSPAGSRACADPPIHGERDIGGLCAGRHRRPRRLSSARPAWVRFLFAPGAPTSQRGSVMHNAISVAKLQKWPRQSGPRPLRWKGTT